MMCILLTMVSSRECPPWLQVLVSVQGLVLTAEPYYNEAGFERQVRLAPLAVCPRLSGVALTQRLALGLAQAGMLGSP